MAELTITQAAGALGVSDDTIRRRIESGKLQARTDEHGRRWVILPDAEAAHATEDGAAKPEAASEALLTQVAGERDQLREQVRFLQQQLDAATQAQEQLRQLLAREQELARALMLPAPGDAGDGEERETSEEPEQPRRHWWQWRRRK